MGSAAGEAAGEAAGGRATGRGGRGGGRRAAGGPATLAYLEFTLAVLEPAGLDAGSVLESMALLNGFVINLVRAELADRDAASADPALVAEAGERLRLLLESGRYPRFAAALAGGEPGVDLGEHFDRLVDRVMDGLIRPGGQGSS
jgi:hypothetical protein